MCFPGMSSKKAGVSDADHAVGTVIVIALQERLPRFPKVRGEMLNEISESVYASEFVRGFVACRVEHAGVGRKSAGKSRSSDQAALSEKRLVASCLVHPRFAVPCDNYLTDGSRLRR
jgi:hypothetical protein